MHGLYVDWSPLAATIISETMMVNRLASSDMRGMCAFLGNVLAIKSTSHLSKLYFYKSSKVKTVSRLFLRNVLAIKSTSYISKLYFLRFSSDS